MSFTKTTNLTKARLFALGSCYKTEIGNHLLPETTKMFSAIIPYYLLHQFDEPIFVNAGGADITVSNVDTGYYILEGNYNNTITFPNTDTPYCCFIVNGMNYITTLKIGLTTLSLEDCPGAVILIANGKFPGIGNRQTIMIPCIFPIGVAYEDLSLKELKGDELPLSFGMQAVISKKVELQLPIFQMLHRNKSWTYLNRYLTDYYGAWLYSSAMDTIYILQLPDKDNLLGMVFRFDCGIHNDGIGNQIAQDITSNQSNKFTFTYNREIGVTENLINIEA